MSELVSIQINGLKHLSQDSISINSHEPLRVLFFVNTDAMPMGIAYISAVLKKAGHQTFGVNGEYEPFKEEYIIDKLKEIKPDMVFLSIMYTLVEDTYMQIAKWVKEYDKNIFVLAGGIGCTMNPDRIIANENVDAICMGEGEIPVLELVNKLKNNQDITSINNLWIKKGGKTYKNPFGNLVEDVDSIPFPDRDIFKIPNLTDYVVLSTRGCPFKCTYCFNHTFQKMFKGKGNYVRRRSPENFIAELAELKQKYHPKSINIHDDTFIIDINWIKKFCELYKQEKIGIPFSIFTHPSTLNEEVLPMLKDAGLRLIRSGLESGDAQMRLNVLKRHVDDESMLKFFKRVKDQGIPLKIFNMIGLPGDTKDTIYKTILFNLKIRPDVPHFSYFQPFPNTEIYDYCKEKGLLKNIGISDVTGFHSYPSIETGYLNKRQVQKLYQIANFFNTLNLKFPILFRNKPEKLIRLCFDFFYYVVLEFQVLPLLYKRIIGARERV